MWNVQARLGDLAIAVDQEVEVDRAGAPAHVPHATELLLDLEEAVEQLASRQPRLDGDGAVEESGLVHDPDRVRLLQLRDGEHVDALGFREQLDRPEERDLAWTEIRAEAHVCERHP